MSFHDLTRLAEAIEIPNCGCKIPKKNRLCVTFGRPCSDRVRSGKCNCDVVRVPRCLLEYTECELDDDDRCACPELVVASCLANNTPCQDRIDSGKCDCPYLPGPPCEHIKALRRLAISDDDFQTVITQTNPKQYAEPDKCKERTLLFDRDTRLATYARRVNRKPRLSCFGAQDVYRRQRGGIQPARLKNGVTVESEHVIEVSNECRAEAD